MMINIMTIEMDFWSIENFLKAQKLLEFLMISALRFNLCLSDVSRTSMLLDGRTEMTKKTELMTQKPAFYHFSHNSVRLASH